MREVEVKILNIDVKKIREKLVSLGAKKSFEGDIPTIIFDSKEGRFQKEGLMLRLRKKGDKAILTFKGKVEKSEFKVREETEASVDSFEAAARLFSAAGYLKKFEYSKHREQYKLGNATFEIDTYKGIPAYVEIEAPDETQVKNAVELLGFTIKDTTNISASVLLKAAGIKTME